MEVFELRQELEDLVAQYANQNSSSSSIGDVSNSNVSSSNSSDDANSSTNSMTTNQSLPKPVIEFGHRIEHSIANLQSQLSALFAMGDYQAATTITIRLKYMEKALEEYREKFNL